MASIFSLLSDLYAHAIVVLYPPVLLFWLIIHSGIDHWRKVGTRAYWVAAVVWPAVGIPVLYFRDQLFAVRYARPWWLMAAGVVAIVAAVRFIREASRVIPARTMIGFPEIQPHKNPQPLLDSGIYARTRNPLYVTHFMFLFGAAALSGFAVNWWLVALDVVLMPLMILTEERELRRRYGAVYEDYMRRVPRFLPKWP